MQSKGLCSIFWRRMLGGEEAESLLNCDSLPRELVLWREPGGMRAHGRLPRRIHLHKNAVFIDKNLQSFLLNK